MDGACDVKGLINNKDWRVDMDIDGDGVVDEDIALAEAVARSFDSELDLYIQENLEGLFEKYNCYNLRSLFGKADGEAIRELERLGIRADAVGDEDAWQNRTYAFSLVDLSGFENKGRFDELMSLVDEGKELSVDEKEELEKLQTELHDYLYSEDAKINGEKTITIVENTNNFSISNQYVYNTIIANCVIVLVIAIVFVVALVSVLAVSAYKRYKSDKDAQNAISKFENNIEQGTNTNTNNSGEGLIEQNIVKPDSSGNTTSEEGTRQVTYYNNFVMIGYIEIPKISIKYPILEKVTKNILKTRKQIKEDCFINKELKKKN